MFAKTIIDWSCFLTRSSGLTDSPAPYPSPVFPSLVPVGSLEGTKTWTICRSPRTGLEHIALGYSRISSILCSLYKCVFVCCVSSMFSSIDIYKYYYVMYASVKKLTIYDMIWYDLGTVKFSRFSCLLLLRQTGMRRCSKILKPSSKFAGPPSKSISGYRPGLGQPRTSAAEECAHWSEAHLLLHFLPLPAHGHLAETSNPGSVVSVWRQSPRTIAQAGRAKNKMARVSAAARLERGQTLLLPHRHGY